MIVFKKLKTKNGKKNSDSKVENKKWKELFFHFPCRDSNCGPL
jgi:hypothetical protein